MKNTSKTERYLNIEYTFERRRYGTMKFFTWLNYRIVGSAAWQSFGDPWPKARLNRRELNEALAEIIVRTVKPGTRLRTILGDGVVNNTPTQPHCLSVQIEGKSSLPLHPHSIIEVMS